MNLTDFLERRCTEALGLRRELLEQMAAAYLLKTDIAPDEAELVETIREGAITWHFQRRQTQEKA